MINLYSGTPGSGKSLHVADNIKWYLGNNRPVIANFYFKANLCRCKKYGGFLFIPNSELNVEKLVQFSDLYKEERRMNNLNEESILLVIDECQLLFNAREWNDAHRKEWISFFSQHRKLGYKVILVAQYAEMIDKQIRALIEYEYIHRKVSNIGIGGRIFSLVLGGNLHVAVKIYKPLREKVGTDFFKADKTLYRLYDTYNRFA